jgi:hypothetical protein
MRATESQILKGGGRPNLYGATVRSDSPSFDADLELIGLHLGRDNMGTRYGAAIGAIVADLAKKGFAGLLGAKLV